MKVQNNTNNQVREEKTWMKDKTVKLLSKQIIINERRLTGSLDVETFISTLRPSPAEAPPALGKKRSL
jgi:hypothetical protein